MRVRLLVALAVVVGAAVAIALLRSGGGDEGPGRARASLRLGLVANALDNGTRRDQRIALAQSTGVRWLREEFRWAEVEPRRGERRWTKLDHLMQDAARRRVRVLPLLYTSPAWAAAPGSALPRDPAAYAVFAAAVAGRYGHDGIFWRAHPRLDAHLAPDAFELWNEPYLRSGAGGAVDPARYAALVAAAGPAIHRVQPHATVLLAGEVAYEQPAGQTGPPWLPALFAAQPGLAHDFDAVAVHPYSPRPPASPQGAPATRFARIDTVERQLRALHAGPRPLWLTEMGWSTCTGGTGCVSEREQAADLAALLRELDGPRRRQVAALFVYRLEDLQGGAGDQLAHYGLLRRDGSRKPAFAVLRAATRGR